MPDAAVYRGLTQAELDSEYDNQRHVPGFREVIGAYSARSAAARAALRCRLDVAYGPSPRQRLDVFLPARAEGAPPVHVFLHGGAWRALTKDVAAVQAEAAAAAGAVFVATGFDLATEVTLAEMVAQGRAAVAWVWAHAAEFGADAGRLTVGGHSSGAHMAAMAAAEGWQAAAGVPEDAVKGALLVSGLYDLEPVRLSYRNALLRLDEAAVDALSPVRQRPAKGCAVRLAVAEGDTAEFRRQAEAFAGAWGTGPVLSVAGRHHYDVLFELDDPAAPLGRVFREVLRGEDHGIRG